MHKSICRNLATALIAVATLAVGARATPVIGNASFHLEGVELDSKPVPPGVTPTVHGGDHLKVKLAGTPGTNFVYYSQISSGGTLANPTAPVSASLSADGHMGIDYDIISGGIKGTHYLIFRTTTSQTQGGTLFQVVYEQP